MSTTEFVEATSADPFVRDLHRKAVRLLNDPTLDRKQRELHIGRLQSILLEHQAKQAAKAEKTAAKAAQREQVSRINRNQGVADPSQVVARRKEFEAAAKEQEQVREQFEEQVKASEKAGSVVETAPQVAPSAVAANDSHVPVRKRVLLRLNRV